MEFLSLPRSCAGPAGCGELPTRVSSAGQGFLKLATCQALQRRQVKLRRPWEGETDYCPLKRLVILDKSKYKAPKYRAIACQVADAQVKGDEGSGVPGPSHQSPKIRLELFPLCEWGDSSSKRLGSQRRAKHLLLREC